VHTEKALLRILDANCNRLREALRVLEEYFRFVVEKEECSVTLKQLRHEIIAVEAGIGVERLLASRNTADDCFASQTRPEELERDGLATLLAANFKRAQEAARVIEEYAKLIEARDASARAKKIRFSVYDLEQQQVSGRQYGKT